MIYDFATRSKINLTEDDNLQFDTIDQQESSIFRVLPRLNLHCGLKSGSRSTFPKQKQKFFPENIHFLIQFSLLNTRTFRN
jgi:hypothetical protein